MILSSNLDVEMHDEYAFIRVEPETFVRQLSQSLSNSLLLSSFSRDARSIVDSWSTAQSFTYQRNYSCINWPTHHIDQKGSGSLCDKFIDSITTTTSANTFLVAMIHWNVSDDFSLFLICLINRSIGCCINWTVPDTEKINLWPHAITWRSEVIRGISQFWFTPPGYSRGCSFFVDCIRQILSFWI